MKNFWDTNSPLGFATCAQAKLWSLKGLRFILSFQVLGSGDTSNAFHYNRQTQLGKVANLQVPLEEITLLFLRFWTDEKLSPIVLIQFVHFFKDGQTSTLTLKKSCLTSEHHNRFHLWMVQVCPGEVLALFSSWKRATVEEAQLVWTLLAHLIYKHGVGNKPRLLRNWVNLTFSG